MDNTSKHNHETLQVEAFGLCIDDSLPNFEVNMWIKKGAIYKILKNSAKSDLVSDSMGVMIEDVQGCPIIPNQELDVERVKLDRLQIIQVITLN
jgi:hypothetical protein